MILDKEIHRQLLLEIINRTAFPGEALELGVELKRAVASAQICEPGQDEAAAPPRRVPRMVAEDGIPAA